MIRLLVALIVLAAAAFGFAWLADRPGDLAVTFQNVRIETSLPVAVAALLIAVFVIWLLFGVVRFLLGTPGALWSARLDRRLKKGRSALARGIIAAAAGDERGARLASAEANRRLGADPLALVLEAQSAQLAGDRPRADRAFARMVERADTRLLGLRGLHAEALRRGDEDAAHAYAERAHAIAPLPWAAQAVLKHLSIRHEWARALIAVEANLAHRAVDRPTADGQRAALLTAMASEIAERDPDKALKLAQDALKARPGFAPAASLAAAALTRRQDIRKAARTIEAAWRIAPHPDLARAYLALRPGDSAADRLGRAQTLARIDPDHPESRMMLARAALEARDFLAARRAMAPLIERSPPTRRMCLLMADIEEIEHGATGALREWLARAARAPRDPAWVAEGFASDVWLPVSPISGALDAFTWKTPDERLSAPEAPLPPVIPAESEPLNEAALAGPQIVAPPASPPVAEAIARVPAPTGATAAPASAPLRPVFFAQPSAPDDPGPETKSDDAAAVGE